MTLHYDYPTVSRALPAILSDLMEYGEEVGSRNGRAMELLNPQIVITDPTRREVLSINRGANVFAQIAETVWVLAGRNDVEWLSAYLPRAFDYADDGAHWRAGYGPRIRNYRGVDQLARVIDMLKKDPLTRQAVIQIWDTSDGDTELALVDRACNTQLQFLSRSGELHLTVTVRSNDAMWGWSGINAFEWSTIQEVVASLLGVRVGQLVFNIGSLHLYQPHWAKARSIWHQQDSAEATHPFNPSGKITTIEGVDSLLDQWFVWEEMCRGGAMTSDLFDEFEDPLFKSWAAAIAYYWTRNKRWLDAVGDTALAVAIARTPASLLPEPVQPSEPAPVGTHPGPGLSRHSEAFYAFIRNLHADKHASYGDSWKKRGEMMSILPNIARKVDRLGVGDRFDSSADTVIDLMVYTAKYLCFLRGEEADPEHVDPWLRWALALNVGLGGEKDWETNLPEDYNAYFDTVDIWDVERRIETMKGLLNRVAPVARDMWLMEDDYEGADAE